MFKSAKARRVLLASVGTIAIGGVAAGSLFAQEGGVPRELEPRTVAPDPGFIQQLSFADLVEEVSPAVVSIRTEAEVSSSPMMQIPPELREMLPPEFRGYGGEEGGSRRAMGQGSGFFIDANGHIVTNNHVIDGASEITAVLADGSELSATLVGTDPSTDIAVLKVEPSAKQRFVQFSEETNLRVGDYVLAVGNPFGLGGSVTSGIVSGIGREAGPASPYANFIQIDASINRGNSGGPTFDLRGNVVGVNTAIISPTGGNVGIGLAVPADVAADVVNQLINSGEVTRGWLGVSIGDLNDLLAAAVGAEDTSGALVQSVQDGSPAQKAGFQDGDVVLRFGGVRVESASDLTRIVGGLAPGKKVDAVVLRDGRERNLDVTLDRRDPQLTASNRSGPSLPDRASPPETELDLGLTLSTLTDQLRARYDLDDGVRGILVTAVEPRSAADEAGLRQGMVITRADNENISTVADLKEILDRAGRRKKEAVLVRVVTGSQPDGIILAMPVPAQNAG